MPLTFAHPALILLFGFLPKRWFSWTGLVIGTLTPDFEYFLRMKIQSEYSHTLYGLFYFDLPIGILLAFLYHTFVKIPLTNNLPRVLGSRLIVFNSFDWIIFFQEKYLIICISILIGATSHIFWDSFTHHDAFFVNQIPILKTRIEIFVFRIPIFKFLQHGSTLSGGVFIIFALSKLPSNQIPKSKINVHYWIVLIVVLLIIVLSRFASHLNDINLGNLIVTSISAGLISLLLTPLILKMYHN